MTTSSLSLDFNGFVDLLIFQKSVFFCLCFPGENDTQISERILIDLYMLLSVLEVFV